MSFEKFNGLSFRPMAFVRGIVEDLRKYAPASSFRPMAFVRGIVVGTPSIKPDTLFQTHGICQGYSCQSAKHWTYLVGFRPMAFVRGIVDESIRCRVWCSFRPMAFVRGIVVVL